MKRSTKLLLKAAIAIALFFQVKHFCHRQTDGFVLSKVRSEHAPRPEWEITPSLSNQEIAALLSQTFTYLGCGGQCYAFLSQDKQLVLKLFKMHHLHQYPFLARIPLPSVLDHWRQKLLQNQKEKLEQLFESSHLAFTELKEESGLLHMQLNPTSTFEVKLIDKIGNQHTLALNDVPFALQRYAENPFKKLRYHIKKHELNEAKQIIDQIVSALQHRYAQGICDRDPALRRNIGIVDGHAIFIDIGAFGSADAPISEQEVLLQETRRMQRWLEKRSPLLNQFLLDKIASK